MFVLKRASANKMIDIVEVRTKEIGLTQVTTETDIRITNSFFLPITILSLKTDLLNRDGLKVGRMSYETPQKIKGKSEEVLTTISQISIITSLFQALSSLLAQRIAMQSVGIAKVKFLWWIFEIPINDTFEIHPSKLKIVRELTEEEIKAREEQRLIKAHDNEIKNVLKAEDNEIRKIKMAQKNAERKEAILKRRHKENYVAKEERLRQAQSDKRQAQSEKRQVQSEKTQKISENEINIEDESVEITLNEKAIKQMADDNANTNEVENNKIETEENNS